MLREYTVFNIDQCENLPERIKAPSPMRIRNPDARDGLADDFLRSSGADIREGHGEAYCVSTGRTYDRTRPIRRNAQKSTCPQGAST
jgi:antirestriction protein ArdC